MSHPAAARLVLDEMFSPAIAAALRDLGQDVIAVAERGELRAMSDDEVFAWAASQGRWLLTENARDFRPILLRALQADTATTGILCASSRASPRSRKNPGPLIQATDPAHWTGRDISAARGTKMLLPLWLRLMGTLNTPMFNFKVVR
ncbi:MAG: DUF5615 family PIN-like protein [Streptosporangiaceae bacterium]